MTRPELRRLILTSAVALAEWFHLTMEERCYDRGLLPEIKPFDPDSERGRDLTDICLTVTLAAMQDGIDRGEWPNEKIMQDAFDRVLGEMRRRHPEWAKLAAAICGVN